VTINGVKIFDGFMFYNELDVLEVRLHELCDVVDHFVLVEANQTFQGNPKPLYYELNKRRFERFHDKIIHIVCSFPDVISNRLSLTSGPNWGRENYQRDAIVRGLTTARSDDLILISDVDEIVSKRKLLEAIENRRKHDITIFTMPLYKFQFNRKTPEVWKYGARMVEYSQFRSAQSLRSAYLSWSKRSARLGLGKWHARLRNLTLLGMGNRIFEVKDAGWHFTSIGDWSNWKNKINSYSHIELKNHPTVLDENAYCQALMTSGEIVGLDQMPAYIKDNPEKFSSLLGGIRQRSPEFA
jgi:beta-1,4-mannosyl-glycoprotein beta-1,4-N-acetylglucosaminyltransferase